MPEEPRQKILERASRMIRQSETLRRLADELLDEANDLREATHRVRSKRKSSKKKK